MIDTETLAQLVQPADCTLSIYLPMAPDQRDQRAPDARLRNLIDIADERLVKCGMELRRRQTVLQPLREFAAGNDFARHRDPGLAFFIADTAPGAEAEAAAAPSMRVIGLPNSPPAAVFVGPDFHIKPLLPLLAANRRFNILALSKANAKLLTATPFTWTELPLEALPIEVQAELDSLPAAEAAPGSEALEQARKSLLVAEPRRIATAVHAALGDDPAPLVLVADPGVAGHFLQQTHLPQIYPTPLHLNPFALSNAELHAKVLELMQPELTAECDTVLEQINARLGTAEPTVAIRLEEILHAAREGRVDAVVVAEDETLWGQFRDEGPVIAHGTSTPEDEDLLNQVALMTMRTGGRAFALPRERLPRQVPAAATLRF